MTESPWLSIPLADYSLRALEGHMTLHEDARMAEWASRCGLERKTHETIALPGGKTFSLATYRREGD